MGQSADYWLSRAEEARVIAGQMKDADAHGTLLRIAERYEALAKRAAGPVPTPGSPLSPTHEFGSPPQLHAGKIPLLRS